jgi:hypothetical protein
MVSKLLRNSFFGKDVEPSKSKSHNEVFKCNVGNSKLQTLDENMNSEDKFVLLTIHLLVLVERTIQRVVSGVCNCLRRDYQQAET